MWWPDAAKRGRVQRYAQAAIGPIGSAAAQFALSLTLLRAVSPEGFGVFSFLLIAANFSAGLWGALFCAPLPVLLAQESEARCRPLLRALFGTSLVGAGVATLAFAAIASQVGASPIGAWLFAGFAGVSLLRWFARTHAYATAEPLRTMWSDLTYTAVLGVAVIAAVTLEVRSLDVAFAALFTSVVAGLLPFGGGYLRQQFGPVRLDDLSAYGEIWRRHAGWSLLGVVTTEATTNAHAYIVTGLAGAAAFAPVAACALLIRPVQVAMNALMEFERAQMARVLGAGDVAQVQSSVRFFRLMLILAWAVTASAAAALLLWWPHLIFPPHYDLRLLRLGTALWMTVAGIRLWRAPESALLQAAGAFRALAFASVLSAGVSIAAVSILLSTSGVTWSIGGIVLGEAIFATWTWVQARQWRAQQSPAGVRRERRPRPTADLTMIEETARP